MELPDDILVRCEARDKALSAVCAQVGFKPVAPDQVQVAAFDKLDTYPADAPVVLKTDQFPGLKRQGDEVVASATRRPWIDSNGYWIRYLKAFYPGRPAVLGYTPEPQTGGRQGWRTPQDTLDLAVAEAWMSGGTCLLTVSAAYRESLLRAESRTLEAWRRLGRTVQWLRENRSLFRQPVLPAVTALLEKGEEGAEFANLLYRHGASPALAPAADPPPPGGVPLTLLSAIRIKPPSAEARRRILAHADSGCTVVVDEAGERAWWRTSALKPLRRFEDREFYALGRGVVVAYKHPVGDPSSYASDVIDLITPPRRTVRTWDLNGGIIWGTRAPAGSMCLHMLNYSWPFGRHILAQVRGDYRRAVLFRPEAQPVEIKPVKRGPLTEVTVPEINRLGVVMFSLERT